MGLGTTNVVTNQPPFRFAGWGVGASLGVGVTSGISSQPLPASSLRPTCPLPHERHLASVLSMAH